MTVLVADHDSDKDRIEVVLAAAVSFNIYILARAFYTDCELKT